MTQRTPAAKTKFVFIRQLELKAAFDSVGIVGGVRLYIPSRIARDALFPFLPGELVKVKIIGKKVKKGGKEIISPYGLLIVSGKAKTEPGTA